MSFVKLKSLFKDSVLYGISGIISRTLTIFLVPVYTKIFLPADYGIINLINITFFLFGLFSVCALDNASARWFYDTKDQNDQKRTIACWFWFQFGLSLIFVIFLIVGRSFFAENILEIPLVQIKYLWFMACGTLLTNILPTILINWYRLQQKPVATVIFSLSQSILTICLTILFVVYFKWHITGVYAALFITSSLFSIIALAQIYPWLAIRFFEGRRIKEMLRYSLPMIPAALAFWILNSTDAYFILYFKDKTEVGLFSIGASLAAGVSLFTGAFQQAWGPFAFSIIHEPDAKKTYANVFLIFGIMSSIIILGMFLFSPEILMLLTSPEYYGASWVAPILSINIVLIGFTYIASIGASIAKNTTFYATGVIIAGFLTIGLDLLLIPFWGKEGSAIATVLAQIFVPVYLFYKSNKLYPIDFKYFPVIISISTAIAIGILTRFIYMPNLLQAISVKVLVLLLFTATTLFSTKEIINALIKRRPLIKNI